MNLNSPLPQRGMKSSVLSILLMKILDILITNGGEGLRILQPLYSPLTRSVAVKAYSPGGSGQPPPSASRVTN